MIAIVTEAGKIFVKNDKIKKCGKYGEIFKPKQLKEDLMKQCFELRQKGFTVEKVFCPNNYNFLWFNAINTNGEKVTWQIGNDKGKGEAMIKLVEDVSFDKIV